MSAWDAVVDVSNVCWSPYLPPEDRRKPHWHRLQLVLAAWRLLRCNPWSRGGVDHVESQRLFKQRTPASSA